MYELVSRVHRHLTSPRKLPGKTLSVGNLTWGGTGKTQLVSWIASQRPSTCAVLSRGYKGGDEATLMRSKGLLVGTGKDRHAAAMQLKSSTISHWVLDDGLQHWALARDVEVVMVDALNPFGPTGRVIPFGTLREVSCLFVFISC
jgi:tetraacyldisaccharide 4'-kinase